MELGRIIQLLTVGSLPVETDQSSGVVLLNSNLVTHNDGAGDAELFELNSTTGALLSTTTISNATNVDWEDICADGQYIYIADFGNNLGDRTDLSIYLVPIQDFSLNTGGTVPVEDTIKFSYSDQVSFVPGSSHNFDAEALVPMDDSLYIFTKNRVDNFTNVYSVSKTPGTYSAPRVDRINAQGLITGGTYNLATDEIMLSGYTTTEHFLLKVSNFTGVDFSGGDIDRNIISVPRTYQIEAIEAIDANDYHLTSETRTDVATLFQAILNTPPTASSVSITGTLEEGQTLNGVYTYDDADGDTELGTTFQWYRGGNPIAGAANQSYTLVTDDVGENIIFEVTPAAASGATPGIAVQSSSVGPILPANTPPTATSVSISGTPEEGQNLNGVYTYDDADGDTELGTTFQWYRGGNPIAGAVNQSYTLVTDDVGENIIFEVTPGASDGVTPGIAVQSSSVGPILPANTPPTATSVSISGTPEEGQTLNGVYTYDDADGDTELGTTFQWYRGGNPIAGAVNQSYPLVTDDIITEPQ